MTEIDIPPEALEAAKSAYTAEIYRGNGTAREYHEAMRIACLAMLKAWPGMEQRTSGHHPRGIGGPGEVVTRRIILPLPQEGE